MRINMADLMKFTSLATKLKTKFDEVQQLRTGEGRWDFAQKWLDENPEVKKHLDRWIDAPKSEAAEEVCFRLLNQLGLEIMWKDYTDLLRMADTFKPEETRLIREKAGSSVEILQTLYRERKEMEKPQRSVKGKR